MSMKTNCKKWLIDIAVSSWEAVFKFALCFQEVDLLVHSSTINGITLASLWDLSSSQQPATTPYIPPNTHNKQEGGGGGVCWGGGWEGEEKTENEDRKREERGIHGNRLLFQPKVNAIRQLLGSWTISVTHTAWCWANYNHNIKDHQEQHKIFIWCIVKCIKCFNTVIISQDK